MEKEKQEAMLQTLGLIIEEWYTIAMELHKHYNCHRCEDPTCCRIPVQVKDNEIVDLGLALLKDGAAFFRDYIEVTPIGLYLKNPCPFLEKGKDVKIKGAPESRTFRIASKCTMHHVRPFMCRMYPFSSMPGVVLNLDICPLAADIAEDLNRIQGKLMAEGYKPERTELEKVTAEIAEELKAALPPEMLEKVAETKNATENMFNMLDKMAPKSTLGDEMHTSVQTGVRIFKLLLKEKQNEEKK